MCDYLLQDLWWVFRKSRASANHHPDALSTCVVALGAMLAIALRARPIGESTIVEMGVVPVDVLMPHSLQ